MTEPTYDELMNTLNETIRTSGSGSQAAHKAQLALNEYISGQYKRHFAPAEKPAEPTLTSKPADTIPPLSPSGLEKAETVFDDLTAALAKSRAENKQLKQLNLTQRQSILDGLSNVVDDGDDDEPPVEEPAETVPDEYEFDAQGRLINYTGKVNEYGLPELPFSLGDALDGKLDEFGKPKENK